jgi:mono/diheme cytochrome c family protein
VFRFGPADVAGIYKIVAMRRRFALALATLLAVIGIAVAGCGGEEEASPSPQTVSGSTTTPSSTTTTTPTSTTQVPAGDAAAGKAIFTGSAGCSGCHTLKDAGATGTVGPNLDQLMPPDAKVVTQVTNGGAAMPAFKGTLTPQQIADVAAYVSSVAGK